MSYVGFLKRKGFDSIFGVTGYRMTRMRKRRVARIMAEEFGWDPSGAVMFLRERGYVVDHLCASRFEIWQPVTLPSGREFYRLLPPGTAPIRAAMDAGYRPYRGFAGHKTRKPPHHPSIG